MAEHWRHSADPTEIMRATGHPELEYAAGWTIAGLVTSGWKLKLESHPFVGRLQFYRAAMAGHHCARDHKPHFRCHPTPGGW